MVPGSRSVAALCWLVLAAPAPAAAVAAGGFQAAAASNSVHDKSGDAEDIDGKPVDQPEADILEAGAEYRGGDIVFSLKVARPTDPTTTKNWEGRTRAAWIIFTGDQRNPDYLVAFGRDEGRPSIRAGKIFGDDSKDCTGAGTVAPDGAFVATVPTGCLGDPTSLRYSADMRWDSDPTNDEYTDDTGIIFDRAPDDGANPAGPVTKP